MIASELSYYPSLPTLEEELALAEYARRHEQAQVVSAVETHEGDQPRNDITAALGTAALAFTGGLVETPPPDTEGDQHEIMPVTDGTQRELGNIAIMLTRSRQFIGTDYNLTTQQALDTPVRWSTTIETATDAAYLLAIQSNSRTLTDQAIRQAAYELAA